jgi:hypothetical protein
MVQSQPGQNVSKTTISENQPSMMAHFYHLSLAAGINGRILVHARLSINVRQCFKNKESKQGCLEAEIKW